MAVAGYAGIALAVLTKGPVALIICGLALGLVAIVSADLRRRLLGLRWMTGLGLVILASAPWFIYMYLRFRHAFVDVISSTKTSVCSARGATRISRESFSTSRFS